MKLHKLMALGGIITGFFVTACAFDDRGSYEEFTLDADTISVVTAVQLGAKTGCSGIVNSTHGNIMIANLEEDPDLVLVLEDGVPLCVDTLNQIKSELSKLEGNLKNFAMAKQEGDEVGELIGNGENYNKLSGTSSGDSSKVIRFDPNPQPAIDSEMGGDIFEGRGFPHTESSSNNNSSNQNQQLNRSDSGR